MKQNPSHRRLKKFYTFFGIGYDKTVTIRTRKESVTELM